ncbi:MAG: PD40 domain-containing protein, partial [Flavobacteriales bacterium]|nr:PD40 domain-containing protein [Flavobacteriales bacterium]
LSINSKYWEGHATMFSDGNRMIFSSNRPGGLGGKDLYSAKLQENGSWGEIENLGPTINTMYDEDAHFLHFDGKTFNFS